MGHFPTDFAFDFATLVTAQAEVVVAVRAEAVAAARADAALASTLARSTRVSMSSLVWHGGGVAQGIPRQKWHALRSPSQSVQSGVR